LGVQYGMSSQTSEGEDSVRGLTADDDVEREDFMLVVEGADGSHDPKSCVYLHVGTYLKYSPGAYISWLVFQP